jgi:hypothetical protein
MSSLPDHSDTGVESQLLDLDAMPLMALRTMDHPVLRQAVHLVAERTGNSWSAPRTRSNSGAQGERID